MEGLLRVGDGRGGGSVDVVLLCCGDNFEEDLRWDPKLEVFVDLVELDDAVNGKCISWKRVRNICMKTRPQ